MPLIIKTGSVLVKDKNTGRYVSIDLDIGEDYAPINSPQFTGEPTAPTPASADDSTKLATTEFVQGHVEALLGSLNTKVLTPSSAFSIPSYGSPVTKTMTGMTANYILVHWGFSSSAENSPPCDLTWSTANGSYTITNNTSGTAPSETIKPVFALPNAI